MATVSSKFQIVIPREIRRKLGIVPGQRIQVFAYGNRIELIPVMPANRRRGFLKGIDSSVPRKEDRL